MPVALITSPEFYPNKVYCKSQLIRKNNLEQMNSIERPFSYLCKQSSVTLRRRIYRGAM